ncbi:sugar ABC transporter substrate-binding protein [Bifidobacterium catenulatum]|uniref:sugar ABC transporter substrate-binding protein n=1 Tax=Bifidobacterium catenulatum TaxID=1686 RepID=UPI00232F3589|nr:sugar ABC transporter substrate-binding protein [Bifidobacterium catenulatum]MDB1140608.1 sugar ABC transporter substrate-binding protein [Bifidobacterium catenulatum]MDB1146346.1 sugar ABC transporter substrate-binding protein [Bifidobacterium catenulatum]MDB1158242.1 sugar ABC transporter substrate-binding protein [Bifidobacterium catenulatum]
MPLFARRAFYGMTAIALLCASLSGCVPSNAAVGDTQSPGTAVAHSMEDRDSLSIAMIGSDDVTADSMAMDAMKAGKLKPVYITVSGTVDAQSTAQQGVRDMAQRKADLIVIAGIDVDKTNAENWNDALETARKAGVPVALLDPIAVPEDNRLYAATMTINDRMTDATPLDDAVVAVANNDPHDREMLVTTIDH